MRINIREDDGHRFKIAIPNGLIMNRMTAGVAKKYIKKYDQSNNTNLSAADINKLFKVIKRFKKKHPDLHLVEVESGDGDRVYIDL